MIFGQEDTGFFQASERKPHKLFDGHIITYITLF